MKEYREMLKGKRKIESALMPSIPTLFKGVTADSVQHIKNDD
jgi:hypothetical protein